MSASKQTSPGRVVVMLLLAGGAWAWLSLDGEDEAGARSMPAFPTTVVAVPACSVEHGRVDAHARELERRAEAAFERAPFDAADVPRAVRDMAEASACYERAHDREGRQRSEARRDVFERALDARVQRATLGLRLASRDANARTLVKEARTLLALTSEAGPSGRTYREALLDLLRKARDAEAAQAAERGE